MASKEERKAFGRLKKLKPTKKWQVGPYSRTLEFSDYLPYNVLLLCKILNITPRQLITDFLDNFSHDASKREGRDAAKESLVDYAVKMGYGKAYFSEEDVRLLFEDFDNLGAVWPTNSGAGKLIDAYSAWRKRHYTYLFKKWFKTIRRKI